MAGGLSLGPPRKPWWQREWRRCGGFPSCTLEPEDFHCRHSSVLKASRGGGGRSRSSSLKEVLFPRWASPHICFVVVLRQVHVRFLKCGEYCFFFLIIIIIVFYTSQIQVVAEWRYFRLTRWGYPVEPLQWEEPKKSCDNVGRVSQGIIFVYTPCSAVILPYLLIVCNRTTSRINSD